MVLGEDAVASGLGGAHPVSMAQASSRPASGQTQTIFSWLALTFAMEHGRWRLVFDQNTLIQKP